MRKVVVAEYLSVDGVMQDPAAWMSQYWNDELSTHQSDQLFASDALLLGRATYEAFAASWPSRSGDAFTDRMNSLPKFVVSRTLDEPLEWNARLLRGDATEEVARLKEQSGQDILVYGSGELVRTLAGSNLIDEYRLMVAPLILGSGQHLFEGVGDRTPLALADGKTTSRGVALLTYRPAGTGAEVSASSEQELTAGTH